MHWLWIALGGALGSALRFFMQERIRIAYPGVFPMGTLAVNLVGFTTFSSFSRENLNLIREGHARTALVYILTSNGLGIGLAFGGFLLARALSRSVAGP